MPSSRPTQLLELILREICSTDCVVSDESNRRLSLSASKCRSDLLPDLNGKETPVCFTNLSPRSCLKWSSHFVGELWAISCAAELEIEVGVVISVSMFESGGIEMEETTS